MMGAASLSVRLTVMKHRAGEAAEKAASLAGENALLHARSVVPVRTGRLQASLKKTVQSYQTRVESRCPYALYVEKGTRKMRAQPYLSPAFSKAADKDLFARVFREALE